MLMCAALPLGHHDVGAAFHRDDVGRARDIDVARPDRHGKSASLDRVAALTLRRLAQGDGTKIVNVGGGEQTLDAAPHIAAARRQFMSWLLRPGDRRLYRQRAEHRDMRVIDTEPAAPLASRDMIALI